MTETLQRQAVPDRVIDPGAFRPADQRRTRRRAAQVLWLLLSAPAMINGTLGSLAGGALSEDDRRRRALSDARPRWG